MLWILSRGAAARKTVENKKTAVNQKFTTVFRFGGVDGTLRKNEKIVDFKGIFCSSLYKNLLPPLLPRLAVPQTPLINIRDPRSP